MHLIRGDPRVAANLICGAHFQENLVRATRARRFEHGEDRGDDTEGDISRDADADVPADGGDRCDERSDVGATVEREKLDAIVVDDPVLVDDELTDAGVS